MSSKAPRAVEILREEGLRSLITESANFATAIVRRGLRGRYSKIGYHPTAPECDLMAEDWDNLLILDACRYDQFERLNSLPGRLESRTSRGSTTAEFLAKNFRGTRHYDTVYVTANPMYQTLDLGVTFYDVIDVWKSGWDAKKRTVPPAVMRKASLEAYEAYPNKRIIAHFMQPHYPFIGESAREIGNHAGFEMTYRRALGQEEKSDHPQVWKLLKQGKVSEDVVWRAYDENLAIVLSQIETVIEKIDGTTVVTSDHGNLVGESIGPFGKPRYGHPINTYTEELRKVPWLVIECDSRKAIQGEQPREITYEESEIVTERLADLGYT